MNCILLFHFILLLISITLLILGISTPRWLVYDDENHAGVVSEHSKGIVEICQRLCRKGTVDQYSIMNNSANSNSYMSHDAYVCFNYLFKWYNASLNGPELLGKFIRYIQAFDY
jgi:hypothetical protein